jgi:hypothetical protein
MKPLISSRFERATLLRVDQRVFHVQIHFLLDVLVGQEREISSDDDVDECENENEVYESTERSSQSSGDRLQDFLQIILRSLRNQSQEQPDGEVVS